MMSALSLNKYIIGQCLKRMWAYRMRVFISVVCGYPGSVQKHRSVSLTYMT